VSRCAVGAIGLLLVDESRIIADCATRSVCLMGPDAIPERQRWNHNIHYFKVLLDAIPPGASNALDVGCGDGMLARRLRERVDRVVAIDLNTDQIALARAATSDERHQIDFIHDDVMTHDFGETFDAVVSVATVHHLDTAAALDRLAGLVSPGGVLAIEGLARSTRPSDLIHDIAGAVLTQVLKRTGNRRFYNHSAPIVWPPKDSFADVRRIASGVLPGHHYRRHPLWRYTIVWTKN
jgi:2-polyprenyl-3-methyl-5-hydroxy-6-metoxy-1,4-benzoquinol methylase